MTRVLAAARFILLLLALTFTGYIKPALAQTNNNFSDLYDFQPQMPNAWMPVGGVAMDSSGALYGILADGGPNGYGAIFKYSSAGAYSILTNFTQEAGPRYVDSPPTPDVPFTPLVASGDGILYAVSNAGGTDGTGTLFKVNTSGQLTMLHQFVRLADGANPAGKPIIDPQGELFGTVPINGDSGCGNVFKYAGGAESILFQFPSGSGPCNPQGTLYRTAAGNLYGTTGGGAFVNGIYCGAIVEIDSTGQTLTLLHTFAGSDGCYPLGHLVPDSQGNLYGVTQYGGAFNGGAIFKITPGGIYSVLYSFSQINGTFINVNPGLVIDSSGFLYGTTSGGGTWGLGTLFKLDTSGNLSTLHSFGQNLGSQYAPLQPNGDLLLSGYMIYGTTVAGGSHGGGALWHYCLNCPG